MNQPRRAGPPIWTRTWNSEKSHLHKDFCAKIGDVRIAIATAVGPAPTKLLKLVKHAHAVSIVNRNPGWTLVQFEPHNSHAEIAHLDARVKQALNFLCGVFHAETWQIGVEQGEGAVAFTLPRPLTPAADKALRSFFG